MHAALKASADVARLGDKYQVLPCGGERDTLLPALYKARLLKKSEGGYVEAAAIFDTIICIRVLCSVPTLDRSLSTLYALLRPGGKFIICEHVINDWRSPKGSVLGRAFQVLYSLLGWPYFIGDCRMDRDTVKQLRQIGDARGGWESVELDSKMEWSALPFTTGILVKSRSVKE
jgi:SAM-dependent methyltransferase